jgi:hypothetical protein
LGAHCQTCQSPSLPQVNFMIARGASLRAVAAQFGLSYYSLARHAQGHISARYRELVAGGPYKSIDALLDSVAKADLKTMDVLDSMIAAHYNLWSLAGDAGSDQGMASHAIRLERLLRLRSEISRELAPGMHLHQTLQAITINGQTVAVDVRSAREKIGDELAKISERLEAGRRAAEQRLIEGAELRPGDARFVPALPVPADASAMPIAANGHDD